MDEPDQPADGSPADAGPPDDERLQRLAELMAPDDVWVWDDQDEVWRDGSNNLPPA